MSVGRFACSNSNRCQHSLGNLFSGMRRVPLSERVLHFFMNCRFLYQVREQLDQQFRSS